MGRMPKIHPTAIISPESQIAEDAIIGPFCILTGAVKLGAGVHLISHVTINGPADIGEKTTVYPGASLGFPGQDFKFTLGMPTAGIVVGKGCLIREHSTIHAATKADKPTRLGDRVFMMVNAHVGHDVTIGDDVIMVNNSACGGHSEVHTKAIISGAAMVHQFDRVGKFAMVSGGSIISLDVPPFCTAYGRNTLLGINVVGMRRNGFTRDQITAARLAFREFLRGGVPREKAVAALRERGKEHALLNDIADFVETSKRGVAAGIRKRDRFTPIVEE